PFTVPLVTDANRSRGPSGASFGHTGPDEQGRVAMTKRWDPAPVLIEDAGTVHEVGWREWRMEMDAGDPASCVWTGDHIASWRRDGWGVSVEARFELRADAQIFRLRESLVAREAGETIFETASVSIIPRDLV
ncbi:MAG TPA: hypothetical protein VKS60_00695, partial [Stellaceae bacterium]|nr:hypothetical protein [Stellaceae bacterium]